MNRIFEAICLFSLLTLYSCKEIAPVIPPLGDKKVLVEEFTGVRCVSCPAGAAELENLKAIHGEKLIIVSIHTGDFAPPYTDSKYDFRTTEGTELEKYMGAPIGYPTAVVNRKKFSGQERLQVLTSSWAGLVANESKAPSVVSIGMAKSYNKGTRDLTIDVKIIPSETLTGDIRLTVMLTEDGVKDMQQTPQGRKDDYTHNHILRKTLTKFDGDPLTNLSKDATLSKGFNFKIPANFIAENCKIIAFVHKSGSEKDVLQVVENKIGE